ncbi:MAG TPA: response regulator, partial [Gemmatimonadaceae bacterium]
SDGKGYKILVVDDDPKAVEVVALRLDAMGSRVLRAYSGQDAIDIARRELPDVIVLDLMMPEISGFDVVAALSETPETAGIPVLVVTAREITDADRARLTGSVAAIMEKGSFNPEDLTSEVRRAMAGRKVLV